MGRRDLRGPRLAWSAGEMTDSPNGLTSAELPAQGLQIIHFSNDSTIQNRPLELLNALNIQYRFLPTMKIQFLKSTSPTITSIGLKPESVNSITDAPSCSIPVPLDVNDTCKNGSADVPDVSCENGQHQENDDEINQPGEVQ
nr:E3 ubiquitin-protein ligase UPL1 [Ipomoea batatas]GME03082.1 E3 ubiquitin-protein ligase UPL1 [Ipomoea batatas]